MRGSQQYNGPNSCPTSYMTGLSRRGPELVFSSIHNRLGPTHLIYMELLFQSFVFFFFLNRQFITRSARADRGSYFVTMYRADRTTWRVEKEKGINKRKEEKGRELLGI